MTSPSFYSAAKANKNLEMYRVTDKYLEKYASSACKAKEWESLPFQEFVKIFMGENTPYNSILITWGTGVGKTCGAVQITETLRNAVQMFNKNIYIIAPANLQQNYKENLLSECSGIRIPKDIPPEEREHYISKSYKFYSYIKFGKLVESLYEQGGQEALLKKFSNCVFVIDEAHNLNNLKDDHETAEEIKNEDAGSEESDEVSMRLLNTLELLFESIKNSKLILLTATPIRNSIKEIVSLLNLLRLNNNQQRVAEQIAFPENGSINLAYLKDQMKGYISYVKGNSQISFPRVEEVGNLITNYPSKSYDGRMLNYTMKHTKVIPCYMHSVQLALYMYFALSRKITNREKGDMFNNNLTTIANLGVPVMNGDYIDVNKATTIKGLDSLVTYNKKVGKYELQPAGYINDKFFLDKENLTYFSTKLDTLVDNLLIDGVHYVYSRLVQFGTNIVSIVCQLFGWDTLKVNSEGEVAYKYTITPNDKIKKRCWCGKLEDVHSGDHPFSQGHIVVYSGETNTNQKALKNLLAIVNSEENKSGKLCKVFIGSRVSGEGVNYKRLRHVHILEPWWNNTVLQQVIGRAARNCSHYDLPKDKQNVLVYKYVAMFPDISEVDEILDYIPKLSPYVDEMQKIINERESSDLSMYRLAESKDLEIAYLTRLLKITSVDCENNYLWNRIWTQSEIEQLKKTKKFYKNGKLYELTDKSIKLLNVGEDNSPECEYTSCDYDCEQDTPIEGTTDDSVLYSFINPNKQKIVVKINQIIKFIQQLHTPMFSLDQLLQYFGVSQQQSTGYTKFDYYNIFDAITEMLTNQDITFDWKGMNGRLVLVETNEGLVYSFDAMAKYLNNPDDVPQFFKFNNVFTNGSNVSLSINKVGEYTIGGPAPFNKIDVISKCWLSANSILNTSQTDEGICFNIMELFDNMNDKIIPQVQLTAFNLFTEHLMDVRDQLERSSPDIYQMLDYYLIANYRTIKEHLKDFYVSWSKFTNTVVDKDINEQDWVVEFNCRYKQQGEWNYYKIVYKTTSVEPFDKINFSTINYNYIVKERRRSELYHTIDDDYIRETFGNILTKVLTSFKKVGQKNAPTQAAIVYEYFSPNLFGNAYNVRIVNQSRGNFKRDNKIDKRSVSTGQECITATKPSLTRSLQAIKDVPEIDKLVQNINSNDKVFINNDSRCKTIEKLFRYLDWTGRLNKRWFYTYGDFDFGNYST